MHGRGSMRLCLAAFVAAGLVALAGLPARGMINPSFTPVHLVKEAQRIVAGKLKATAQADRWELAGARVLKGPESKGLRLSLAIGNPTDANEARGFLRESAGCDAVLFRGEQTSYLLVANIWMEAKPVGDDAFHITEFRNQRLPKTYAGAADRLIAMVDYILHDADADVPVAVGVKWQRRVLVGRLDGSATGVLALTGGKGVADRLFVASPRGDRLFGYDKAGNRFEDQTKSTGVDTGSRVFAFVDLNRDGWPDWVSWDGGRLQVRFGDKDGRFASAKDAEDQPLDAPCNALLALGPGQDGAPGLLVDAGWPRLLTWTGQGWQDKPLPGDKARRQSAGEGSRCVVADWDGDGYADVLQIREQGSLVWRGAKGGFEEPRPCAVKAGEQGTPVRWCVGDFDTDGRLDLLVCGAKANELWENAGDGNFLPVARYAGSLDTMSPGVCDCLAADLNHDGRPDVVALTSDGTLDYHFNRGYRCLANEGDLRLDANSPAATTHPKDSRPARMIAGDFNGDGVLDLAVAYTAGEVVCFLNGQFDDQARPPGVWIRLPPGHAGPVAVSVWQGEAFPICVGTYTVDSRSPTYAALRSRSGCTLKWRWPAGPPREVKAKGNSDVALPVNKAP